MKANVTGSKSGQILLQNIRKQYGTYVAVDDVNLTIAPGEFISLLGPSGSGKTTTLMMIAGFELPNAGKVLLDGKDITKLPSHRRQLGVIFQNYALFPHMTVEENVAYPLRMRRVSKPDVAARVRNVLEQVQLTQFASRYPHQLSGGQQQRVAIARALVFDPPVLLLDEPLGALDKKLRQHLRNEIKSLHNEVGKTMIYVTHDQDEALAMSDRVAVMSDGRIRQVAAPRDIYQKPADLFVAGFVGEANFIPFTVDAGVAVTSTGEKLELSTFDPPTKSATICVRPEHLKLNPSDEKRIDGISGHVTDLTFVGDATMVHFKSSNGLDLTSKIFNTTRDNNLSVGDACFATWAQDDITVLSH
ncbi:Spermidine/putrescine ABC transporter ATP-binding subunit [Neorhizobium galegae bv. officinalis]|uniref:Spermidine/putrescine import ATP-binding protein PotA n=1 Tax=Neorhizobium galegae bv. officinalis TaxID=323656 RepID=A0A0T7H4Z3_NEOGA|nr:ABC transporter ATP-binding protein [Neorhizobium galegae]CDZ40811.1 Spermidine/putrescine ABC transporter ATP-binding subunit [Neorhizobium galegae bv. officinalis]CDZ54612.1 Spermidine/putrescine ABC transporter ATP-binding subunit [Neorhizobium galegae bv. officinalis]